MDINQLNHLKIIGSSIGCSLTEEQMEMASDFTKPLITFANPGTGKTSSALVGLVMAQTYHKVAGREINAMSFTRKATQEFAAKYEAVCKKCNMVPTVVFNTFHSICRKILMETMPGLTITSGYIKEQDLKIILGYLEREGCAAAQGDYAFAKRVLMAINKLNSALIYDDDSVTRSYTFSDLDGISVEIFQQVRKKWFMLGRLTETIAQGDIPVHCLYALLLDKSLQEKSKRKYKIMVVDEFQDLSLLHLKILSLISTNLVAIGDMKQQIYYFNGACQEIVTEYMKMYPDAKIVEFTKSFRCADEIAYFATNIISPNFPDIVPFKGVGEGGEIQAYNFKDLSLSEVVAEIKTEQIKTSHNLKSKDVMFLFRNNFSVTPIAEELYKQKVDFRVSNFKKVMDIPIFAEMCALANLAWEPSNRQVIEKAVGLMPEFKGYAINENPLLLSMEKSGKGLFDINYRFAEQSSHDILNTLKKVSISIERGKTAAEVLRPLYLIYEKYIIRNEWWRLEREQDFYVNLVKNIINTKTYIQMVNEEYDKANKVEECVRLGIGCECYTIHSAKGLEADEVYILDCDDILFPSKRAMTRYKESNCSLEAARELRNERNLLYVACTRAKTKLSILYDTELSSLLANTHNNAYSYLDDIYRESNVYIDEMTAFKHLFKVRGE